MLTISSIEETCEAKGITLVMHPAVRRAAKPYAESFYVGVCSFLKGGTDGVFFLPLRGGGYVRLLFSKRRSPKGHPILRLDPATPDGLTRIKNANKASKS